MSFRDALEVHEDPIIGPLGIRMFMAPSPEQVDEIAADTFLEDRIRMLEERVTALEYKFAAIPAPLHVRIIAWIRMVASEIARRCT